MTVTLQQDLFAGVRTKVGFVGVDSGRMAIGGGIGFTEHADRAPALPFLTGNVAVATSGYGDGGYDVLAVVVDGERRGLEVLFWSPAAEAAAQEALLAAGIVEQTPEVVAAVHQKAATPQQMAAYSAFAAASDHEERAAYERLVPEMNPSDEARVEYLGPLYVTLGAVAVGDPGYGAPELVVELPLGRYAAVAWTAENERTTRLGIYRFPVGA